MTDKIKKKCYIRYKRHLHNSVSSDPTILFSHVVDTNLTSGSKRGIKICSLNLILKKRFFWLSSA